MNRGVSESVGGAALAHGYDRSAFQAVSGYDAEAGGSVTDPKNDRLRLLLAL